LAYSDKPGFNSHGDLTKLILYTRALRGSELPWPISWHERLRNLGSTPDVVAGRSVLGERHLILFPTLGPSSLPVVVAQPDKRQLNRTATVLEWYDRHRA